MNCKNSYIKAVIIAVAFLLVISCSFTKYAESDSLIISGKKAMKKVNSGYILVDAQKTTSYMKEHVKGAVNIERNAITVKTPVPNSLAPAGIVAEAAGEAGLTENSDIVIYDDNKNMDASRLFWTLKITGHKGDILIVSGGLQSLAASGAEITKGQTPVTSVVYNTDPIVKEMISSKDFIASMIDNPADGFVLIDVRSDEEYNAGTIPGSIHINHEKNLFSDYTFRPVQHIRILYKEQGIMPEDNIVMFCKSSVRAANTYATLYNAGYRNLKVYDGAWLEWSAEKMPIYKPETEVSVTVTQQDNS